MRFRKLHVTNLALDFVVDRGSAGEGICEIRDSKVVMDLFYVKCDVEK